MKIISKNTQNDILKRIIALQIIADHTPMPLDHFDKICEHLSNIAYDICGQEGCVSVMEAIREYREYSSEKSSK